MNRKALIYLSGILTVLLVVFLTISVFDLLERRKDKEETIKSGGFDKLRLTDLEYTHTQFGQESFSIHIEELLHKKRKIGPLTLNPVKELELNDVHIAIFQDHPIFQSSERSSNSSTQTNQVDLSALPLRSIFGQTFRAKELGFISRVRINSIRVEGFQNGLKQWSLFANKAEVGLKEKGMVLKKGVSLTTKGGQSLVTQKLEWKEAKRAFYAPGVYVLKDAEGEHGSARAFITVSESGEISRVE